MKDRSDFSKQFGMTIGKSFSDVRVKRYLLADIEEFLRVKKLNLEVVQRVRNLFLQYDGNGKYRAAGKDNLGILTRDLIDDAFDVENYGNIDEILTRYIQIKEETFGAMKQSAVIGAINGAKNYLEKLIKMQTKENSFGQNQTLLKFKDFIT